MATPTIREAVAAANAGASATATTGAGTQAGDLLVCFAGNDFDSAANYGPPTGTSGTWTLQATGDGGANGPHIKIYTRPVTAGGAQTVTLAPSPSGEEVFCHVIVVTGVNTSDFVDGTPAGSTGAASTSQVAPATSPTTTDALLLCGAQGAGTGGGNGTYTPPAGMTERTDITDGTFAAGSTASLVLTASGSTGTKSFTGPNVAWATATIAIKGGATGPTTEAGPLLWQAPGLFRGPSGSWAQPWPGTGFDLAAVTYDKAGTGAAQPAALGSETVQNPVTSTKTGLGAATLAALGPKTVTTASTYTKAGLGAAGAAALGSELVQQSGVILKTGLAAAGGAALGSKTVQNPVTSTKAGTSATTLAALGPKTVQQPVTSTKAGTGALNLVGAGVGRITTGALWAGSEAGVSSTWVNTAGAVGGTTGDYATWTDLGSSTVGALEAATFGAYSVVPNAAPIDMVTITVRHSENPAAQIASVTAQAYRGTVAYGSPQALTVSSTVHDDQITVSGLAYADLADLRVRVTATRIMVPYVKTGTAAGSGAAAGTETVQNSSPAFIATTASDGTHFLDQYSQPRLLVGEDNWAILANGGAWNSGNYQSAYDTYFTQRAAQGYNAVEVTWCSFPQPDASFVFNDGRDWDGTWPFATTMNPTTTPVTAFWNRRDYFLSSAAANGFTVVMNTSTTWLSNTAPAAPAQASWTTAQWQAFGTFLGNRYKNTPNILWIVGDDYFGEIDTQLNAWLTSLRATGDTHPVSIQLYQEGTSRQDLFTLTKDPLDFSKRAQYEWCYSYNVSYDCIEKAQNYVPTALDDVQTIVPAVWGDGAYLASATTGGQTDVRLERQMIWWALSSGACGFSTGDNEIWGWGSTSAGLVTSKSFYANVIPAIVSAFTSLTGWQQLAPDTSSQLVTGGRGTHAAAITSGGSGTYYTSNTDSYVTASRTPDTGSGSSLAVIYCAQAMNITINQTKMTAGYTVTWIDPVSGATFSGTPGSTYNSATARGNNSAGDPDWVLVLRG